MPNPEQQHAKQKAQKYGHHCEPQVAVSERKEEGHNCCSTTLHVEDWGRSRLA
jgi:hypothetical protein